MPAELALLSAFDDSLEITSTSSSICKAAKLNNLTEHYAPN